jgi:hypothetical protein
MRAMNWVLSRVVSRAGHVDPEACRHVADRVRSQAAPMKRGVSLADRVSEHYARRAAWHGSASSLPLGPLAWVAGYLDAENMARTKLELPATLAYLADPAFFERADWRELVERWAEGEQVQLSPGAATALSRLARGAVRRFVHRAVRRRIGRLPASILLPLISTSLHSLWNYLEVMWTARAAKERYREQIRLPSVAPVRAGSHLHAVPTG